MAAKRPTDTATLEADILALLPEDGTPVLNRVMRVMLARRLERPIAEADYFAARDVLLDNGRIGLSRGQGGQLYLASPEPAPSKSLSKEKHGWPEHKLMQPLRRFLEGPFRKSLELLDHGACIVQDTSASGPKFGKWAQPDFILVSAMRFALLPGAQVDLHSFELKTEAGGGVLAIHEALAQTRFTHFGHFVWHLPKDSKDAGKLDDIVTHCDEHGIGLIRMLDPDRAGEADGCEVLVDPRRKPTLGSVVDGFLDAKLTHGQKDELRRAIGGAA